MNMFPTVLKHWSKARRDAAAALGLPDHEVTLTFPRAPKLAVVVPGQAITFAEYQREARKTAVFPPELGALYPALGLCGEAGEVAEQVKKTYRDDGGVFTETRKDALRKEIGDVLWYIAALADQAGLELADIAQDNIDKLRDRQARGKLSGSGNDR